MAGTKEFIGNDKKDLVLEWDFFQKNKLAVFLRKHDNIISPDLITGSYRETSVSNVIMSGVYLV